jgi:hypothetical protein
MKNKPEEYFHRKLDVIERRVSVLPSAIQNKKSQAIAGTVILPDEIDIAQTMVGEKCAQQLRNVPLPDNAAPSTCC